MTSEVVVMNRLGIALASDSAATVYMGGRSKIYHADKLFMLSHLHPVGVMVYNNSSLLGVPWETILKMFRKELGPKSLPTLEEYGDTLIEYLNKSKRLFPQKVQDDYYLNLVETLYRGIDKGIQKAAEKELIRLVARGKKDNSERQRQLVAKVINESLEEWRSKKDVTCFDPRIGAELATRKSGEITLIRKMFDRWRLEAPEAQALQELAALVVSKDEILQESLTGLVIAGFGDEEHLPVMRSYKLGEIFGGRLKYKKLEAKKIDSKTASVVEPFAERDMVSTFLNGISPIFEWKLLNDLAHLVLGLPDAVIDGISGISRARKEALKQKMLPQSIEIFKNWWDELENQRLDHHLAPILQSIAFLPKNELAHVAASLVNLNSFQKRMSIREDETVGGPIDVAVISKGDGFVWIERKHYFKPELNRHFFKNYGVQPVTKEAGQDDQKAEPNPESDAEDPERS